MKVISSMATRQLLADHVAALDIDAQLLPMGGVEAARRVRGGEACDVVVLAADAIDRLQQSGHVDAGARIDWVRSGVAVAVPAGAARTDLSNGAAVRQAVVAANRIGVSTGPSGVALTALFARWGLADAVAAKTVQAPPGVPVASLVARGEADLGFQQLSELMDADGITLVGMLPDDIQIWTTFSAAVATTTLDAAAATAFLQTLSHPARAEAVRRHGMEPLNPTPAPPMIIDCHGHYTTAPKSLEAWRNRQIAGIADRSAMPRVSELRISDDELRESIEGNQLRLMRERGSDLTIFSPRASFMAHHIGDFEVSSTWAAICNELCFRVAQLFPDHFIGAAMLPQSPGVDPATCLPELEKCVREYGFVGINLNPDPSGGHWTSPPLTDRQWWPVYEKMVEHDIPAMVHVSTSCNVCFHTTGAHYLNADTTAVMQFIQGDLFKDFPTLKFVIPHGGGAVPYHWGRFRGLAQEMKKPLLVDHILNNVFFDTCVYHQPGIDLLATVIPVDNILFASEMIGAVRGIDPETGNYFDDTRRYVDATAKLSADDRAKVFEGNARRVYPRLDAALKARGR